MSNTIKQINKSYNKQSGPRTVYKLAYQVETHFPNIESQVHIHKKGEVGR